MANEYTISTSIADGLGVLLPQRALWWHTANETGGIGARRGAMNKRMGVRPGVPDYMIVSGGRVYGIEVKVPGRSLSRVQKEFRAGFEAAGGVYGVVHGVDELVVLLKGWGLTAGRARGKV